jgi:hypothetical protein
MFRPICELPSETRRELALLGRRPIAATPSVYLEHQHRLKSLLVKTAVGSLIAAGLAFATHAVASEGRPDPARAFHVWPFVLGAWSVLTLVWTAVCGLELVRAIRSDTRPLLLVSPKVLVRGDYAHGSLEAYVLRNAVSFQCVRLYKNKNGIQTSDGNRYDFVFPDGEVSHTVKCEDGIRRMDETLACARDGTVRDGVPTFEHLVLGGGGSTSGGERRFTRPGSPFWIATLVIGYLGGLAVGFGAATWKWP